ncbi:MAG: dynamin family protein [Helicobacteraceae bacterium]
MKDIVKFTTDLEACLAKYVLEGEVYVLRQENGVSKSHELEKQIKDMQKEGRMLRLGNIGRVKSGKSSLINALIFDGEDILPKAATLMTAALTVLQYGQNLAAEVDFFSQQDIDDIARDARRFQDKLKMEEKEEFDKLLKLEERKQGGLKKSFFSRGGAQDASQDASQEGEPDDK